MGELNDNDRREVRRYKAREGAFAVLPMGMRLGQIDDISPEGLSFHYVPLGDPRDESKELEIYSSDQSFHLKRIPFETISDTEAHSKMPFSYLERRRYSVRFKQLSMFQQNRIDYFIKHYTVNGVS